MTTKPTLIGDAQNKARTVITSALQQVKTGLEGTAGTQPRVRLNASKQLQRYFSMTEDDFAALKEQKGEEEFRKYVMAMNNLAKGGR